MEIPTEYYDRVANYVFGSLNSHNRGITESQFYAKNILDATGVSEKDMQKANDSVVQYCKDVGCYAALPPFEEGAFIDSEQGRYIHWHVLEVEDDSFLLGLDHYPLIAVDSGNVRGEGVTLVSEEHKCWYLSCRVVVRVKVLTSEEHKKMLSHHPDYVMYANSLSNNDPKKNLEILNKLSAQLKSDGYVGGVVESYEYFIPQDFKRICKKGKYTAPDGSIINGNLVRETVDMDRAYVSGRVEYALQTMLFVSTGPMIEMLTYVNYMLSQKSTGCSTLRKVSSAYMINPETQDLRKERHFGKLKMVSEKKPRAITEHNIQRIYTTISWQRRSHIRHLASGKVVPVKSAVCKRHNLGESEVSQVVYKV